MTIWIFISFHMLADFVFQPTALAKAKMAKTRYIFLHAMIYTIVFSAGFLFIRFNEMILPFLIILLSHFTIDFIRAVVDRKLAKEKYRFISFLLDQFLHITVIIISYLCFQLDNNFTAFWQAGLANESLQRLIVFIVTLIIIWEPAAILVKKLLLSASDAAVQPEANGNAGAGEMIGKLERVIVAVLVMAGQLGTIGFVLTAKSLARFKQLTDKDFAEKYLIGTLSSTAIAVIVALVLKSYLK